MNPINWMFGRRTRLTLEAIAILAHHAATSDTCMRARNIFNEGGMPFRYLEPSLQRLVRAHILEGCRGPNGGYRLTPGWRKISIGAVLDAVSDLEEPDMAPSHQRGVETLLTTLGTRWRAELDAILLPELVQES